MLGEIGDITAHDHGRRLRQIQYGEVVGDISELIFRDPDCFKAGELHNDFEYCDTSHGVVLYRNKQKSLAGQEKRLSLSRTSGISRVQCFKGESYDSERPAMKVFRNNVSCKPFVKFVEDTAIARVKSGAISLLGKVGVISPPHIVLPLIVKPTKPRLCHHASYLIHG